MEGIGIDLQGSTCGAEVRCASIARRRYAGRAGRSTAIPESRMSQLPTHPLAALPLPRGNRRISAGSTVDAASGPRRPTLHTNDSL